MPHVPVYMDNHATTRVDPRVLEAMLPYFSEMYGNAASVNHCYGWEASDAVEAARAQVARLLCTDPRNLIFTSGATEANNLALKGVMRAAVQGSHLIINAAEHKAVLDPAKRLAREGYDVTVLPVDQYGMLDPQQIEDALQPNTVLVSAMSANNEVGSLNLIAEIAAICGERGVLFHCDAAQSVGKQPWDFEENSRGPAEPVRPQNLRTEGIGVLYVRHGSAADQDRTAV